MTDTAHNPAIASSAVRYLDGNRATVEAAVRDHVRSRGGDLLDCPISGTPARNASRIITSLKDASAATATCASRTASSSSTSWRDRWRSASWPAELAERLREGHCHAATGRRRDRAGAAPPQGSRSRPIPPASQPPSRTMK